MPALDGTRWFLELVLSFDSFPFPSLFLRSHRQRQPLKLSKKSPFKNDFEKWDRNAEKRLVFGVPHNILASF